MLGAAGRHAEAVCAARETLSVLRELEQRFPGGFPQQLASAHCNLGHALCQVGCHEQGLSELDQATIGYAILAAIHPYAFEPKLAWSHIGRANALGELDRLDEAIAAGSDAIAIQRRLSKAYPEPFQAELAGFLRDHAARLRKAQRWDEAISAAPESMAIYRKLDPNSGRQRTDLISSVSNLAVIEFEAGHHDAAETMAEEASAIAQRSNRNPGEEADVANSYSALAGALRAIGRHDDASRMANKAMTLYRRLVAKEPDRFRPELARALWRRAWCPDAMNLTSVALAHYVEAISNLTPAFRKSPRAFSGFIMGIATDYLALCIRRGIAADTSLIAPLHNVRLAP